MTITADRVYDALVYGAVFAPPVAGVPAWLHALGDPDQMMPPSAADAPPSVLEALVCPNEAAASLARLQPSAELMPVLAQLTPDLLDVDGQIDALVAIERHIGLLQARSAELLAALEVTADATEDGFTRDHVAAALRMPPASMRNRMSTARDLTERLPATLDLLRAGQITHRHAVDLAEATLSLTPELTAAVETAVLKRAPEQTVAQFRAAIRRAVLKVASPAEEEKAHTDARQQRRVIVTPVENGMAELWAYLPADDAAQITAVLDAMAHQSIHSKGGDTRTADQRRADALVHLAAARLADPHLSKAHGQRPGVQVTVAASTLMGLDDQPADLTGYGAITAAMARRIAFDPTATWRRLLTDDHGLIQSVGTKTYRPPADMTRTVIARDVHCQYPGCRRKAHYTDLDHLQAYRPGDRTTQANLISLCRRHHRFKHSGLWTVHRDDTTAITTWTDRKGRSYQTRPPAQPTTTTTEPNVEDATPTAAAAAAGDLAASQRCAPPADGDPNLEPPPF